MRQANRIKGNRTPWDARNDFEARGWKYDGIIDRAKNMRKANKIYRFGEDGYQRWLKDDKGFLARALNDTRHLSKVAFEYLKLVCPDTRVIPGRMTAMLRAKFGLNDVLGLHGEKNRNDHRHHAVDACVIGVTDQGMLQRFAKASASAREKQLNKLVENMPLPWNSYRDHVQRAIGRIWVSHKPDHSHEGAMHNDTAYGLRDNGKVVTHKTEDGERKRIEENLKVIEMTSAEKMTIAKAIARHGELSDGRPKPYKGYKGDSNFCIEIVRNEKGKWEGEVISTFEAYQIAKQHGIERLRHPTLSMSGKLMVMRLIRDDFVRIDENGKSITLRVCKMREGQIALAEVSEANVDARTRTKELAYVLKAASSLQKSKARRVTISPIGELRDPGFKE
jgi:CRISPR-associated endonuclease Csn1